MELFLKSAIYILFVILATSLVLADHHQIETSMWGFTPSRNLVSDETNLPTTEIVIGSDGSTRLIMAKPLNEPR